jgi:hypothetical protein
VPFLDLVQNLEPVPFLGRHPQPLFRIRHDLSKRNFLNCGKRNFSRCGYTTPAPVSTQSRKFRFWSGGWEREARGRRLSPPCLAHLYRNAPARKEESFMACQISRLGNCAYAADKQRGPRGVAAEPALSPPPIARV